MRQQQLEKRPPFAERLDDGAVRIWAPRLPLCSGEGNAMEIALPTAMGHAQEPVPVSNGDFSLFEGDNGFAGWKIDGPGVRTFRDEEVFATGHASRRAT